MIKYMPDGSIVIGTPEEMDTFDRVKNKRNGFDWKWVKSNAP